MCVLCNIGLCLSSTLPRIRIFFHIWILVSYYIIFNLFAVCFFLLCLCNRPILIWIHSPVDMLIAWLKWNELKPLQLGMYWVFNVFYTAKGGVFRAVVMRLQHALFALQIKLKPLSHCWIVREQSARLAWAGVPFRAVLFCSVLFRCMLECHFEWHIRQAVNPFRLHSRLVCAILQNTLCCQTLWLAGWLTWKECMWLCMLFLSCFNSFDIPIEWKWRDTYMCVCMN